MDENPYRAPREQGSEPNEKGAEPTGMPRWVWSATGAALLVAWGVGDALIVAFSLWRSPWKSVIQVLAIANAGLLVFVLFMRHNRPTRS
jgi:hypothetical protein